MPGERISVAHTPQPVGHTPRGNHAQAPVIDHTAPGEAAGPLHRAAPPDVVAHRASAMTAMNGNGAHESGSCTSAQLRRFIKSRPYVPMHELRRRFELNGGADDVTAIPTPGGLVYMGLPGRESQFIADLVRLGDVGLELCHDPRVPMVMGVFAIRPITRQ
ncbi:hypothetical protein BH24CHL8_BH24CHL8_09360 [soil metagenome]